MANEIGFTFSDTVAGYVTGFDRERDVFTLKANSGREYNIKFAPGTYAWIVNNLEHPRHWCGGQMRDMLTPGRYLYAYSIFYPEKDGYDLEAQYLVFPSARPDSFDFERQDWWIDQIRSLGAFYLKAQFNDQEIDYKNYRTTLSLSGEKSMDHYRQETDTISRLVYGFASAYLLSGDDRFLEGAEKGTLYLRDHMRFYDPDEKIAYWYHGIDVDGRRETKIFASEFGDDFDAIPAYEQIYALAGPIQTYRITGDPAILRDAELTVDLFDRFFLDKDKGGISRTWIRSCSIHAPKALVQTKPRRTGTRSAIMPRLT